MALITQAPSWRACTTNLTGTPSGSGGVGVTVTTGVSNAMGAVTTVWTACPHDIEYLEIFPIQFFTSTANTSCAIDFVVDLAGGTAWNTTNLLIANLICGGKFSTG